MSKADEANKLIVNRIIHHYEDFKTGRCTYDRVLEMGNHLISEQSASKDHQIDELKNRLEDLSNVFKKWKTEHELPNDNDGEYNQGYVKAMNDVINSIRITNKTV